MFTIRTILICSLMSSVHALHIPIPQPRVLPTSSDGLGSVSRLPWRATVQSHHNIAQHQDEILALRERLLARKTPRKLHIFYHDLIGSFGSILQNETDLAAEKRAELLAQLDVLTTSPQSYATHISNEESRALGIALSSLLISLIGHAHRRRTDTVEQLIHAEIADARDVCTSLNAVRTTPLLAAKVNKTLSLLYQASLKTPGRGWRVQVTPMRTLYALAALYILYRVIQNPEGVEQLLRNPLYSVSKSVVKPVFEYLSKILGDVVDAAGRGITAGAETPLQQRLGHALARARARSTMH